MNGILASLVGIIEFDEFCINHKKME